MPPLGDDVQTEWKSLYTEELQQIWDTERKELRSAAMVFHVLKREFAKLESMLNSELDGFRLKVELIDNKEKSIIKSPTRAPIQIPAGEDSQINKSPKLNRQRRNLFLNKSRSYVPLEIQNQQKSGKSSLPVPKDHIRQKSEELFNSSSCDSPLDIEIIEQTNLDNKTTKSDLFKTPAGIKRLGNADVVDCSLVVEDTPNNCANKKAKWSRKHASLKGTQNKIHKAKDNKSFTLIQAFDNFPNQKIHVNKTKNTLQNKLPKQQSNLNDETSFDLDPKNNGKTQAETIQSKKNVKICDDFSKDYDKIPVQRTKSPQHVYKTETVRRKADRMKLPGWSCSDCEKYYQGLNLSPEELRKKMNACSKHRNKFPMLDTTPKGFWNVSMPPTQESQHSDTTFFNL